MAVAISIVTMMSIVAMEKKQNTDESHRTNLFHA
jgi:hypothetical protein